MMKELNIIYSQANPEDEPKILSLLRELEGDRSEFNFSRFFVAKDGGDLVGCVRTKIINGGYLELASLAVNKKY